MPAPLSHLPTTEATAPPDATTAEILTTLMDLLSEADTLEQVTDPVTVAIRALVKADGATFVLREDEQCFYAEENAISPLWKGSRFAMTDCISGWSMLRGEVAVVPDIYTDDRVPHGAYRPTFVASLAMVPVRPIRPNAAIGAYWGERHAPSAVEVRMLQIVANSAAVALDNLELRGALRRRVDERDQQADRAAELEAAIHTVAHDLRSPLGAIMGYAEMLGDSLETEQTGRAASNDPAGAAAAAGDAHLEIVRTIEASSHRMAAQMDRMLSLYRLSHRPLAPAPVDVTAMALAIIRTFAPATGNRDLEFVVDDGLCVLADPDLTRVVLENLLGNAVKYTARESRAVIELSRVRIDHVGAPPDLTTLVVRDNGVGFAAEESHRLFHPLTRLHDDRDFAGTGLGLASVARIVERHGGQIRAEGAVDEGASFFVTLPSPTGLDLSDVAEKKFSGPRMSLGGSGTA